MLHAVQFVVCFIGTSNVEQPSNLTTTLGDSSFVYSWEHRNEKIVDHYQLDLEWEQDGPRNQTLLVTDESVTIPCSPGVSYSATVRAVTVCPGIMSAPVSTPGMYISLVSMIFLLKQRTIAGADRGGGGWIGCLYSHTHTHGFKLLTGTPYKTC